MEQPASETGVHNATGVCERCHAIINKHQKLLADADITPPRRVV